MTSVVETHTQLYNYIESTIRRKIHDGMLFITIEKENVQNVVNYIRNKVGSDYCVDIDFDELQSMKTSVSIDKDGQECNDWSLAKYIYSLRKCKCFIVHNTNPNYEKEKEFGILRSFCDHDICLCMNSEEELENGLTNFNIIFLNETAPRTASMRARSDVIDLREISAEVLNL